MKHLLLVACLFPLAAVNYADNLSFSTFVPSSSIAAVEAGNNSTIAFTYAGDEFVGSVYFGPNNSQLYSTNLAGGNVQLFGSPIPGASGEVVVGASLGLGGFGNGNIYAGSQANGNIYQFSHTGGVPTVFANLSGEAIRQIFFDPGSSFGGDMIVTTSSGNVYTVDSNGVSHLLVSLHTDSEGMDILASGWGTLTGDLVVSSEQTGAIYLINPSGKIDDIIGSLPGAETVSFVPTNLNPANALQGFYVANYPFNIQFAPASDFTSQGLGGDLIVTDEFGGNTSWFLSYNGGAITTTPFGAPTGNSINQFEDGVFVTPQRINDTVPEPSSVLLLASVLAGSLMMLRRKTA